MAMTPEERRAYQQAREARLKAEREADPVKMAEWQERHKGYRENRLSALAADPDKAAAEKARAKRNAAATRARMFSDPERLAAHRERHAERERERRARKRQAGIVEPRRRRRTKPSVPKSPETKTKLSPKPKPPPINPDFTPFLVSSPDMSAPRMPELQHRPHEPEPKLPFVFERESWKPSEHFQALLDASDDAPSMTIELRRSMRPHERDYYLANFGDENTVFFEPPPPPPKPAPPKSKRQISPEAREAANARAREKYELERQAKIEAGTYRPPGNPNMLSSDEEREARKKASHAAFRERRRTGSQSK